MITVINAPIIVAHLIAEAAIQDERAIVLRQWSLNTDFQLQARVCEKHSKALIKRAEQIERDVELVKSKTL